MIEGIEEIVGKCSELWRPVVKDWGLRDVRSAKNEEKGCPDQYRLIADSFSEEQSCENEMITMKMLRGTTLRRKATSQRKASRASIERDNPASMTNRIPTRVLGRLASPDIFHVIQQY